MNDRWLADLEKLELSERQPDNTYKPAYLMVPIELPPGSTEQYEKAQAIVGRCLGPDGDLYIDRLASAKARNLIRAIAAVL